ncbi:MAG: S-adenosylmethionine:tRNA ribosyltransferase-isomerase [Ginsengibacter sp.]
MHPKYLSIHDFDYYLPQEKIAGFPLEERDQSKLLIYKNGSITEDIYLHLANHLPVKTFLVFNDTKVIKARLLFKTPSGGVVEIFCLGPHEAVNDYAVVLQKKKSVKWQCMIGGAGKWKQKYLEKDFLVDGVKINLTAALVEKLSDAYIVELSWSPADYSFGEIMAHAGEIPLPPYIKRKALESDAGRYQTIYSLYEGSVAAPTAGLHFTEKIFTSLEERNIGTGFVTLHVGAGTFKPVKSDTMENHEMHAEWMDVSIEFIEQLVTNIGQEIFCVGTTSVRTVESLYWMGIKAMLNPGIAIDELEIKQWDVYEEDMLNIGTSPGEALGSLLLFLHQKKAGRLLAKTQIIITPGYQFRVVNGMITNFHQPGSTLLLLVAAMAGGHWKEIYKYALINNFRFLSYGDGCLVYYN